MGLWLKQGDDIIPVSGGGGGGTFEGEHVLTGDPDDPPTGWEEGQLLWDGNTTAYNGDEINNDPNHTHESAYLSLDGGTLTGDLQVDGALRVGAGKRYFKTDGTTTHSIVGDDATARPLLEGRSQNEEGTEVRAWYVGYGYAASNNPGLQLYATGETRFYNRYWGDDTQLTMLVKPTGVRVTGDLQVDGAATVEGKRVVTVTTSNGTPPSGASEGDIHIQV